MKIFPKNVLLGATIETNRNYPINIKGKYPPQTRFRRYISMKTLDWEKKVIAIEPIMNFDLKEFKKWIYEIEPKKVSISLDNYGYNLENPDVDKVIHLSRDLSRFTDVHLHGNWLKKDGAREKMMQLLPI